MIENRLSIVMGEKKIEKRDITRLTQIDRHTLNNIYKGNVQGIKFDTLNKLCYALDCTPSDILRYIPDEN
ncbi:helix-turn-helix transcriptional regulator [bacterium]|nr:helix-turn-helix transcriptional regulator [bacterium]